MTFFKEYKEADSASLSPVEKARLAAEIQKDQNAINHRYKKRKSNRAIL